MEMDSAQFSAEREKLDAEKFSHIQNLEMTRKKEESLANGMKQETDEWIGTVLRKLGQEDLMGHPAQDLYRYYSCYCIDIRQTVVRACLEQHREPLPEEMSKISDEPCKNLAGFYTADDTLTFCLSLDNNTWTRGHSVTLVITQLRGNAVINTLTELVGSLFCKNELVKDKDILLGSI